MKKAKTIWSKYKSYILLALIILLALKVFLPELDSLEESIQALKSADLKWVLFGQIIFFFGLPILAYQYMVIALRSLKFWLTYRVQMASLFVSKLFPSSLGSFALNFYYLTKEKHDNVQATTVMAVNAITSGLAYVFIIGFALIFDQGSIIAPNTDPKIDWTTVIKVIVLLVFLAGFSLIFNKVRSKAKATFGELFKTLGVYKNRKIDLLMATILNFAGSLTSLFALWASAHAIGVDITLSQALVAYVFGNIAAGLVPTPGGIGAAEAGIYSGLVLVGIDITDAFTITLIYRLLTYWVPILPGYYYFWSLRKNVLKSFSLKKNDVAKIGKPSNQ